MRSTDLLRRADLCTCGLLNPRTRAAPRALHRHHAPRLASTIVRRALPTHLFARLCAFFVIALPIIARFFAPDVLPSADVCSTWRPAPSVDAREATARERTGSQRVGTRAGLSQCALVCSIR